MNKADKEKIAVVREIAGRGELGGAELVGEPYLDDHILCCNVKLRARGAPQWVRVSLLWCGWEIVAAAQYAPESATARADLIEYLKQHVGDYEDTEEGNEELLEVLQGFQEEQDDAN